MMNGEGMGPSSGGGVVGGTRRVVFSFVCTYAVSSYATRGLFLNMAPLASSYEVKTPPVSLISSRKTPGDVNALQSWVEENAAKANAMVASADKRDAVQPQASPSSIHICILAVEPCTQESRNDVDDG